MKSLGLNKDTMANAKKAGINISEITKNLLKALTCDTHLIPYEEIVKSYEIFLMEIQKILKKYNQAMIVGMHQAVNEKVIEGPLIIENIVLNGAGLYAVSDDENGRRINVEQVLPYLDYPNEILENLFKKLTQITEKSQSRVQELNFALRLLQSLSEDTEKENEYL